METTHKLDFESAPYNAPFDDGIDWNAFRIGTCHGLWASSPEAYLILAIKNTELNNGHFNDVLEWFEHSCKRDKKDLIIMDFFMNRKFQNHLVEKRGFHILNKEHVIKKFK